MMTTLLFVAALALPASAAEYAPVLKQDPNDRSHSLLFDAGRVYVGDSNLRSVFVLDAATRAVIGNIAMPSFPGDFAVAGGRLFVATWQEEFFTVVNPRTLRVEASMSVGGEFLGPSTVATNGDMLYVSDSGSRLIQPYRASTLRKVGRPYFSGSGPNRMVASDGKLFIISTTNITDTSANHLRVIDAVSGAELLDFAEVGKYNSIFRHTDGVIYSTAPAVGGVVSIQPQTLDLGALPVQGFWPQALASWGPYLVVLNRGSLDGAEKASLEVLDPRNPGAPTVRSIDLKEISAGEIFAPRALIVTPSGDVFVESESLVSVISGALEEL